MKKNMVTAIIILSIIIFSIWAITKDNPDVSEELAKCIGENSVFYVRTGCFACETQKDLFKENLKHLQIVNCMTQAQECINQGVSSVPTWIINNNKYVSVQTIDKLKTLTGC